MPLDTRLHIVSAICDHCMPDQLRNCVEIPSLARGSLAVRAVRLCETCAYFIHEKVREANAPGAHRCEVRRADPVDGRIVEGWLVRCACGFSVGNFLEYSSAFNEGNKHLDASERSPAVPQ